MTTRLLASVTNAEEAETAIAGGADIIDLKDPSRGALGALPLADIRSIVERVARRRPVSATIGDLPPDPSLIADAVRSTAATGVEYVKVGFFTPAYLDACLSAIAPVAHGQPTIAVLFADRSPPLNDLAAFADAGFAGVMLDTADKSRGRLTAHASLADLHAFVDHARSLGLLTGLAGALRLEDLPALLPVAPDYLGFRGGLCAGGERRNRIDPARLQAVRAAIRTHSAIRHGPPR